MSDIVDRLRDGGETCGVDRCRVRDERSNCLCAMASAEIERLRAALVGASSWLENRAVHAGRCANGRQCTCGLDATRFDVRAALEGGKA